MTKRKKTLRRILADAEERTVELTLGWKMLFGTPVKILNTVSHKYSSVLEKIPDIVENKGDRLVIKFNREIN